MNNRKCEAIRKINLHNYWNISLKYTTILIKNIDNKNLHEIVNSIYGSFCKHLKSNKIIDNKNVWFELLNINKKVYKNNMLESTIRKIHLTNIYNNLK
tara:strand:- start:497 stop:790 length:294 start_codon:yes stop_codon:yes gene_type:complete